MLLEGTNKYKKGGLLMEQSASIEEMVVKIQEIKAAVEEEFLDKANVLGVGIGYKEVGGKETTDLCLQVYVEKKLPQKELVAEALVPETVDGLPTDVVEVGVIEAQTYTACIRPARPGYSIGHYRITAGTFGALVKSKCCSGVYILSNNHVLANSNNARIGDPILQPGPYDRRPCEPRVIGRLAAFVPIHFGRGAYNLVDAALARPIDYRYVMPYFPNGEIPRGTTVARLGMKVVKFGRTTQYTRGIVRGVDVTVGVRYGGGKVGFFRNQILTTNMSRGGDSGSLLLSSDGRAVGLLFAGSSAVTIHNNIHNVLIALGIEILTA